MCHRSNGKTNTGVKITLLVSEFALQSLKVHLLPHFHHTSPMTQNKPESTGFKLLPRGKDSAWAGGRATSTRVTFGLPLGIKGPSRYEVGKQSCYENPASHQWKKFPKERPEYFVRVSFLDGSRNFLGRKAACLYWVMSMAYNWNPKVNFPTVAWVIWFGHLWRSNFPVDCQVSQPLCGNLNILFIHLLTHSVLREL